MPLDQLNLPTEDYESLVRMSQPEIAGASLRPGLSGMAGAMYGEELQRHHDLIDKAAHMAQIRAMLEGQQADEWMQGAPGRQAETQAGNINAQGDLALAQQGTPAAAKAAQLYSKLSAEKQADINNRSHIWSQLANAKSPEEVQNIGELYGDQLKVGNKDLRELPWQQQVQLGKGLQQGITDSAKNLGLFGVQDRRNVGWAERAQITADGNYDVAELKANSAKQLKQMGIDTPQKMHDAKNALLMKEASGEISPRELDTLNAILAQERYTANARVSTAPDAVSVDHGKIVTTPKQAPDVPVLPPANATPTPPPDATNTQQPADPPGAMTRLRDPKTHAIVGWKMRDGSIKMIGK